ncbi:NAD kinase 2, mitochondrial-like isoform X2 [Mytilus galloprovincialis]|uniref:NAD kinase 2, mitochondrial-like isoform X2 n=1 Tax=Mytilus galloprovincialis TaxID=29158 RepID=UPI003F7BEE9C
MHYRLFHRLIPIHRNPSAYLAAASSSNSTSSLPNRTPFKPKTAVVLSKVTRYEFEKRIFPDFTEQQLKDHLESKRSDYDGLLERHNRHYSCVDLIERELRNNGIEAKVVQRFDLDNDLIGWADVIFTAGGDGTFLLAADKVRGQDKPVVGLNSDPNRWLKRQRIRITIAGHSEKLFPTELKEEQLLYHEHRFLEHMNEKLECSKPIDSDENGNIEVLPIVALNEVFIGEAHSSRVSYYEMKVDDEPHMKEKSSGITICTGTGSTSWHFHINQLSTDAVQNILSISNSLSSCKVPVEDTALIREVTKKFNESLVFDPSEPRMAYTIRDPIRNDVFSVPCVKGVAKRIQIRSRMWDAHLVIDGGFSYKFNDGAIATLEIHDEDALKSVEFD